MPAEHFLVVVRDPLAIECCLLKLENAEIVIVWHVEIERAYNLEEVSAVWLVLK